MKPVTSIKIAEKDYDKIRPLHDLVLVKQDQGGDKIGNIFLPDVAKKPAAKGTVIAVGPGKLNVKTGERTPTTLKPGDVVYVPKWGGDRVEADGKDRLLFYKEEEILAVEG